MPGCACSGAVAMETSSSTELLAVRRVCLIVFMRAGWKDGGDTVLAVVVKDTVPTDAVAVRGARSLASPA